MKASMSFFLKKTFLPTLPNFSSLVFIIAQALRIGRVVKKLTTPPVYGGDAEPSVLHNLPLGQVLLARHVPDSTRKGIPKKGLDRRVWV